MIRYCVPLIGISLPQFRAIMVPLKHDELMAECYVLSGQVRDDIELSGEPATEVFDDLEHH